MSKGSRNRQQQAREKIAQARAAEARRKRRQRWLAAAGGAVIVVAAAVVITIVATSGGSSSTSTGGTPSLKLAALSTLGTLKPAPAAGTTGPEGAPVPSGPPLTGTATKASGQKVDGIGCNTSEQTLFHIHAHLTLFVNGTARQVPAGIGIPGATGQNSPQGQFISNGKCFYWLHTHAADGIVHIESPVHRTYTLGNFFDEWHQPLSPTQVAAATGTVVAFVNGKRWTQSPRAIPLVPHAVVQLDVGAPAVGFQPFSWTGLGL